MKLPNISGWTALVVVAGIAGVCLLTYLKASPEQIMGFASAFIALAGALSKLFPGGPPPDGGSSTGAGGAAGVTAFVLAMTMGVSGCAFLKDAADVTKDVLTVADIVCLETGNGSQLTDAKAAAEACRIISVTPEVIEIIEKLIGQREVGKRAGFTWQPMGITETVSTKDGGR